MAKGKWNIPKHELESLARVFLPAIQAYFKTEEGQREYAEWEAEQAKLKANEPNKKA